MKTPAQIEEGRKLLHRAKADPKSVEGGMLFGALAVIGWVLEEDTPASKTFEQWLAVFREREPKASTAVKG
jgi:hypothetical protein